MNATHTCWLPSIIESAGIPVKSSYAMTPSDHLSTISCSTLIHYHPCSGIMYSDVARHASDTSHRLPPQAPGPTVTQLAAEEIPNQLRSDISHTIHEQVADCAPHGSRHGVMNYAESLLNNEKQVSAERLPQGGTLDMTHNAGFILSPSASDASPDEKMEFLQQQLDSFGTMRPIFDDLVSLGSSDTER